MYIAHWTSEILNASFLLNPLKVYSYRRAQTDSLGQGAFFNDQQIHTNITNILTCGRKRMQATINSQSEGFTNEETAPMMESKFKCQAVK